MSIVNRDNRNIMFVYRVYPNDGEDVPFLFSEQATDYILKRFEAGGGDMDYEDEDGYDVFIILNEMMGSDEIAGDDGWILRTAGVERIVIEKWAQISN